VRRAGFDAFIAEFKRDAAAKGVSQKGPSALNGLTLDPSVLADKRQGVFKQTFEEFSRRMISRDCVTKGMRHMQTLAPVFKKVEVVRRAGRGPRRDLGSRNQLRRQPRQERGDPLGRHPGVRLPPHRNVPGPTDSLRIVERGDLRPAEMLGDWAGDFGQTSYCVILFQVRGRFRRRGPA